MENRVSRIVAAMHCVRVSKYMHRECPQFFVDNDLAVAGASYTRRNIIRDVLTRLTKQFTQLQGQDRMTQVNKGACYGTAYFQQCVITSRRWSTKAYHFDDDPYDVFDDYALAGVIDFNTMQMRDYCEEHGVDPFEILVELTK